jgi:hypothetical protein
MDGWCVGHRLQFATTMPKSESDSHMGPEAASERHRGHDKRNEAQAQLIKKAIQRRRTHAAHMDEIVRRSGRLNASADDRRESGDRDRTEENRAGGIRRHRRGE